MSVGETRPTPKSNRLMEQKSMGEEPGYLKTEQTLHVGSERGYVRGKAVECQLVEQM